MEKSPYPYDLQDDDEELYQEMQSVASATECTGLMPAAPLTNDEVSSLREIYNVPPGQRDVLLNRNVDMLAKNTKKGPE